MIYFAWYFASYCHTPLLRFQRILTPLDVHPLRTLVLRAYLLTYLIVSETSQSCQVTTTQQKSKTLYFSNNSLFCPISQKKTKPGFDTDTAFTNHTVAASRPPGVRRVREIIFCLRYWEERCSGRMSEQCKQLVLFNCKNDESSTSAYSEFLSRSIDPNTTWVQRCSGRFSDF